MRRKIKRNLPPPMPPDSDFYYNMETAESADVINPLPPDEEDELYNIPPPGDDEYDDPATHEPFKPL